MGGMPTPRLLATREAARRAGIPLSMVALAEVAALGRPWTMFAKDFADVIQASGIGAEAYTALEASYEAARAEPRLPHPGPFQGDPPPGFRLHAEVLFMQIQRAAIRAKGVAARYLALGRALDTPEPAGGAGWTLAAVRRVEREETVVALEALAESLLVLPEEIRASAPAGASKQASDIGTGAYQGVHCEVFAAEWDLWARKIAT